MFSLVVETNVNPYMFEFLVAVVLNAAPLVCIVVPVLIGDDVPIPTFVPLSNI